MLLNCPSCGHEVPEPDISATAPIRKCPACGIMFRVADALQFKLDLPLKFEAEKPERFRVAQEGAEMTISYRWFSFMSVIMLLPCALLVRFGIFLVSNIFGSSGELFKTLPFPVAFLLLGMHSAPLLIGLVFAYYLTATFFNTTRIRIKPGGIIIRNGPLPWPGNNVILKDDLDRFYCEETRSKKGGRFYHLSAVMRDGSDERVLSGFRSREEAMFIEQQAKKIIVKKIHPSPEKSEP